MEDNINLVTGFWYGRGDRSEQKYLDNFKNVLNLNFNMTVFVPKVYEDLVKKHRSNLSSKTEIILTELDDIKTKYISNHWSSIQKIRTNPEWYNSTPWLKTVPQSFSEWYNPIVMSKVYFMYKSYELDTFNSNTFIWIDAGITQHIPLDVVCDLSIKNMASQIKYVTFNSVPYKNPEVHGFDYKGFKKYTDIIPSWLCRATIFGCHKDYIETFKNNYDYYLGDSLKLGYMGTEESIFNLLTCVNPDIYTRYHTEDTSMPDLFLEHMKNLNTPKDLIIGAISNYTPDKIQNYIKSINTCGFTGDKIMISYDLPEETISYLQQEGWQIVSSTLQGHPHMKRLIDIFYVLKSLENKYRYVITTDVRDVVFQTNPSDFLENYLTKEVLVSSENILYKNEPWGNKNIMEGYGELWCDLFKDTEICNVGVLAGTLKGLTDLLLLNYMVSQGGNTEHYTDQSSFNFIINNYLIKDKIQIENNSGSWALQYGTLNNPKVLIPPVITIKNNIILNHNNPFCIVHQYDRDSELNNLINNKYK